MTDTSIDDLVEQEVGNAVTLQSDTCKRADQWYDEPNEPDAPLIEELIEKGEVAALVGPSKAGKSYVGMQVAVCIATGTDFLGYRTVKDRVYVANLEVSAKQYKKRLVKMCETLGIDRTLLGDLYIDNLKGKDVSWSRLLTECKARGATTCVVDPFYRTIKGEENDPKVMQDAVDQMSVFFNHGITLVVVFHAPKGFSGDRQLIDMISGSSILARFPESIIGILTHASSRDCRVFKCILRNYRTPDDFTIRFVDGAFQTDGDIPPICMTAKTAAMSQTAAKKDAIDCTAHITAVLTEYGIMQVGTLVEKARNRIKGKTGETIGEKAMRSKIDDLVFDRVLIRADRLNTKGGGKPIGLPEQMRWYTHPELSLEMPTLAK